MIGLTGDEDRAMSASDDVATPAPPDATPGEAAPADTDQCSVEDRLLQLETELAAEQDRRLRALAELQNFRRRTAEERAQQLQYASEQLLSDLIPVIDHFEMATEAADATDETRAVCRGYELILEQLRSVVARHGLTEITAAPGVAFDPLLHEAVERVETPQVPEGTVVRVMRRGYKLHDRVLRPAQVAVASLPH